MLKSWSVSALFLLAALLATPALAQGANDEVLQTLNTAEIVNLLDGFGIKVEERSDALPDGTSPRIAAYAPNNAYFVIYLAACAGTGPEAKCTNVQFRACWAEKDVPEGKLPDMPKMNAYQRKRMFGRGTYYEEEKSVCFDHGVQIDGGVTRMALRRTLSLWFSTYDNFMREMGL